MENPYPKDVVKWDNKEKIDFDRGRFNQHCFEVWDNCKKDILELIGETFTENWFNYFYITYGVDDTSLNEEMIEDISNKIKELKQRIGGNRA